MEKRMKKLRTEPLRKKSTENLMKMTNHKLKKKKKTKMLDRQKNVNKRVSVGPSVVWFRFVDWWIERMS